MHIKREWLNGSFTRKIPNTHRSLYLIHDKGIGRNEKKNGKKQDFKAVQAETKGFSVTA